MFEEITNSMLFGKVEPNLCRLTLNGNIAIRCNNGDYKTYNVKKNTLTNVTNFCVDFLQDMFFIVPAVKLNVGDIILAKNGEGKLKPNCVIKADKKIITVISYESGDIRQILPERHFFMNNMYFYSRIISLAGNMVKNGSGLKSIIKMKMMMSLFGLGGNNNNKNGNPGLFNMFGNTNTGDGNNSLMQMMFMSQMFGGGGNLFGDMFNFDFDFFNKEDSDKAEPEDKEDSDDESNIDEIGLANFI